MMDFSFLQRVFCWLLLSFMAVFAYAEEPVEIQSLPLLTEKIENFVREQLSQRQQNGKIVVSATHIDNRLQLPACPPEQLEVFDPYQKPLTSSTTLGVRCGQSGNHWSIYVPTKIAIHQPILVANKPLVKGAIVQETDLSTQDIDIHTLRQGYYNEAKQIIGQICSQNINPGSPFTPLNLQTPILIHRGEQVTIVAASGALRVAMRGVALDDARLGELVNVRNLTSKRTIQGQASAAQEVKVTA